ncbi:DUF4932 domain-containing protein [Pontibacter locisalis]|uniref:DUF4932 domain-containing protein n=1 Tax=Pontibacter locisalis TaxID=1719035 RepID=A0ABW5IRH4_9BACT
MKTAKFLLLFLLWSTAVYAQDIPVKIESSETYELANVILAITPYGKADPWEVYKKSPYYQELLNHFDRHAAHPLIAKVNYSREEWDKYLSFRTDSYVFDFDENGMLKRRISFSTQQGLNPFEENIELINDFVKVSGFREFYSKHKSYYDSLIVAYQKSQMLPEMISFLQREFGSEWVKADYAIVISPLVYRMNCHRQVSGVPTDFITLPEYVLNQTASKDVSEEQFASGLHMLFTEMDHGFVNPVTAKHSKKVISSFNSKKWDTGSGYEEQELATFNEYMTWAAYDLFLYEHFPQVAQQVSQDWAMQNESRGFFASSLFNAKLKELYDKRKKKQTIHDLYPAMLKWCRQTQDKLIQPIIASSPQQNQEVTDNARVKYEIVFSEPMVELDSVDVIQVAEKQPIERNRLVLTKEDNSLAWSDGGRKLHFELDLENGYRNHVGFNVPWVTKIAVKSKKGVNLMPYKSIIITNVQVAQN